MQSKHEGIKGYIPEQVIIRLSEFTNNVTGEVLEPNSLVSVWQDRD